MNIKEAFIVAFRDDGQDHVWVSPFSKTEVGRVSSIQWRRRFFVPQMGDFLSPSCFANWVILTGNEVARFNPGTVVVVKEKRSFYKKLLLFAKYHQLCSLRAKLEKGRDLLDLPWVEYKLHSTNIKEFVRDTSQANLIKSMVQHIIESGPKVPFETEKFSISNIRQEVLQYLKDTGRIS